MEASHAISSMQDPSSAQLFTRDLQARSIRFGESDLQQEMAAIEGPRRNAACSQN